MLTSDLQPLAEFESETGREMGAAEMKNEDSDTGREGERAREHFGLRLSILKKADWEPARGSETMTTRQPILATNPVFSPPKPGGRLGKG